MLFRSSACEAAKERRREGTKLRNGTERLSEMEYEIKTDCSMKLVLLPSFNPEAIGVGGMGGNCHEGLSR